MNKKKLFLWSLYDFANSIVFINFLLYFSQWMVVDGGLSDFWYNAIFAITSIMLFLSAPTLAAFTDKHGGRKYLLNVSTLGTFLGYGLATVFAYLGSEHIFLIALFFLIGQYFYQLSFVFYNTLIEDVADTEHRARASGIGQFASSLGQIVGLILAIPLSATRLQPLVPSLLVFLILAMPMMIWFKDSMPKSRKINLAVLKDGEKEYLRRMKIFFLASVAVPMLIAFFFFNDAFVTITNNYAIYLERVFAMSDDIKNYLLMGIMLAAAIGGLVAGKIADTIGALKALKYILIGWVIFIPLLAISNDIITVSIFSGLLGLLLGAIWAVTRAYLSEILKKEELGYGFSYYTIAERFATLFGPLTWGGLIFILGPESMSYRIALGAMVGFVIIGLIVLVKWKRAPKIEQG